MTHKTIFPSGTWVEHKTLGITGIVTGMDRLDDEACYIAIEDENGNASQVRLFCVEDLVVVGTTIFARGWRRTQERVHEIAVHHGWWDGDVCNDGEKIALMHSELSEALETLRTDNNRSQKAFGFSCLEEELADVVIRIMDYAQHKELDLPGAIEQKMTYNDSRPHRHGGKAF